MDEDGAQDADASASPRAPLPKLKSAITSGGAGASSSSLVPPKKNKGRGFRLRICLEVMKKLGDWFLGWFFLTVGSISLVGFLYAAILSKLLPPSDNAIISSIQNDWYYIFLVPLTLPILMIAVYFHWLCMKLFKHA